MTNKECLAKNQSIKYIVGRGAVFISIISTVNSEMSIGKWDVGKGKLPKHRRTKRELGIR